MSKEIKYSVTYLGIVEVEDDATEEDIQQAIANHHNFYTYADIEAANDVEWEEV